ARREGPGSSPAARHGARRPRGERRPCHRPQGSPRLCEAGRCRPDEGRVRAPGGACHSPRRGRLEAQARRKGPRSRPGRHGAHARRAHVAPAEEARTLRDLHRDRLGRRLSNGAFGLLMKLRPRLALSILITAIPLTAIIAWARADIERSASEQAFREFVLARMDSDCRERCEASPETFRDPPEGGPGSRRGGGPKPFGGNFDSLTRRHTAPRHGGPPPGP